MVRMLEVLADSNDFEWAVHFRGNWNVRWLSDERKSISEELKCFSDETRWRNALGVVKKGIKPAPQKKSIHEKRRSQQREPPFCLEWML